MTGQSMKHQHHHVRFYIFMITLVVGGLFFLLLINNEGAGMSIGSAIVGYSGDNSSEDPTDKDNNLKRLIDNKVEEATKDVPVLLSFDRMPVFNKRTRSGKIELNFDDVSTNIKINKDALELSELKDIELEIEGFKGEIDSSEDGLSLNGEAKRIKVNDIAFSSKEGVEISFKDLEYNSLTFLDLELDELKLEKGNGQLTIGKKLQYSLENEKLTFLYLLGKIEVDKGEENSTFLGLEGNVQGLNVGGNLLNLNLW